MSPATGLARGLRGKSRQVRDHPSGSRIMAGQFEMLLTDEELEMLLALIEEAETVLRQALPLRPAA